MVAAPRVANGRNAPRPTAPKHSQGTARDGRRAAAPRKAAPKKTQKKERFAGAKAFFAAVTKPLDVFRKDEASAIVVNSILGALALVVVLALLVMAGPGMRMMRARSLAAAGEAHEAEKLLDALAEDGYSPAKIAEARRTLVEQLIQRGRYGEALTDYLWPIVREIIKTAVENQQNLIVEGCYVPADWRRELDAKYLSEIRFICLAMTDKYIDTNYAKIMAHSCDIEQRLDDSDCTLDSLKEDNRAFIQGFREAGEAILLIDSDYNTQLQSYIDAFGC